MTVKARLARVHNDRYGGGLILLIGLFVAHEGIGYRIGSLSRMGPGFFPTALGVILVVTGALIALLGSSGQEGDDAAHGGFDWRGWFCILLGIVAFVVLGRHGGLIPATFVTVFVSALGDRDNTVAGALILAAAMTAICVGVFWWGLQLQMPLFQWD